MQQGATSGVDLSRSRAEHPLPGPAVRLFASETGDDLVDELRAVQPAGVATAAPNLMHVTAKLQVPATERAALEGIVAACPGVVSYAGIPRGETLPLLLIGTFHALEECAQALCHIDSPAAALGPDMVAQLRQLYPRRYGRLQGGGRTVAFSARTGIMGILNVTPDSFYDGGRYDEPQAALDRAHQLVAEGADIIDIGGQSSRPGSEPVSEAEEARRVLPVVRMVAASVPAIISVDTYRASIASAALDLGAHLINDISAGRFDPALLTVVVQHRVPLILMHMQGLPRDMHLNPTYEALIDEVFAFLQARLKVAEAAGVAAEHLLIDPGIGFGKGARHNLEVLRKLHHFQALGRPIVIGTSRKSFIGRILGTAVDERLEGTSATVAVAIAHGASVVRVHDVQAMARVARMMDALVRPNFAPGSSGHEGAQTGQLAPHHCAGE